MWTKRSYQQLYLYRDAYLHTFCVCQGRWKIKNSSFDDGMNLTPGHTNMIPVTGTISECDRQTDRFGNDDVSINRVRLLISVTILSYDIVYLT